MVTHHPYLGLAELSSDLSWDLHTAAITNKAHQILAFPRRNLGNYPVKVKEQSTLLLYRPHLEYACSAWDPRLYKHILEIEKISTQSSSLG